MTEFAINPASVEMDDLLADFYRLHWIEMGIAEGESAENWREAFHAFVADARARKYFGAFVLTVDGEPVGGACCQTVERVYPRFLRSDARIVGYVWGVYVSPLFRGLGHGAALVNACIAHLRSAGAGRILLHSGERSKSLYLRNGFRPTDELSLSLDVDRIDGK